MKKLRGCAAAALSMLLALTLLSGPLPQARASETLQIADVVMDPESLTVGETASWTAVTSGGSGDIQYEFILYWGLDIRDESFLGSEQAGLQPWGALDRYSFTPSKDGIYFLHVHARDALDMRAAIYRYTLFPPLRVESITADRSSAVVGEPITWTTVSSGASGYEIHSIFTITRDGVFLERSEQVAAPWDTTAFSFRFTPAEPGEYRAYVWLYAHTQAVGAWSDPVPVRGPLAIDSVTADQSRPLPGAMVTWSVSASGGAGEKAYGFRLHRDGVMILERDYSSESTFSAVLSSVGAYSVTAFVRDDTGSVFMDGGEVTVATWMLMPLGVLGVLPEKTLANPGDNITWTVIARGGSGEKQYSYDLYLDDVFVIGWHHLPDNSFSYQVMDEGRFRMHVAVTDDTGTVEADSPDVLVRHRFEITRFPEFSIVTATPAPVTRSPRPVTPRPQGVTPVPQTVTGAPVTDPPVAQVLFVKAEANPAYCSVKSPVTVTALAGGGTGSYQYHFLVFLEGAATGISREYGASNSFTFRPQKPGNYKVRVIVKDGENKASVYTGDIHAK